MRLWERRSLWFRLLVPSVFFAVIHLADEQFSFERFSILLVAAVVQGLAYALTGNIGDRLGKTAGASHPSQP